MVKISDKIVKIISDFIQIISDFILTKCDTIRISISLKCSIFPIVIFLLKNNSARWDNFVTKLLFCGFCCENDISLLYFNRIQRISHEKET